MNRHFNNNHDIKKNYINNLLENKNKKNKFNRTEMVEWFDKKFYYIYKKIDKKIIKRFWKNNKTDWMNIYNKPSKYLFIKSFTHKSYYNNKESEYYYNYERLEWIGDSHLNYLLSRYIYHNYNKIGDEHLFSLIQSYMKSTEFLSKIFDFLDFEDLVLKDINTPLTDHIKEDIIESFIHSFYCNFGIRNTKTLLNKILNNFDKKNILMNSIKNKTILNELLYKKYNDSINNIIKMNIKNNRGFFICLGYSINGRYYKNYNHYRNKNKKHLEEILCGDILKILYKYN